MSNPIKFLCLTFTTVLSCNGFSRCKLLHIEWINNMVLLYSIGNCIQYPVVNHNGQEYEKECIYMYN